MTDALGRAEKQRSAVIQAASGWAGWVEVDPKTRQDRDMGELSPQERRLYDAVQAYLNDEDVAP